VCKEPLDRGGEICGMGTQKTPPGGFPFKTEPENQGRVPRRENSDRESEERGGGEESVRKVKSKAILVSRRPFKTSLLNSLLERKKRRKKERTGECERGDPVGKCTHLLLG